MKYNFQSEVVTPGTLYEVLPDGRWAIYVDNHLISTFANCEAQFYLAHIRHLRPKGRGYWAMNIGSWWSAVLEHFYKQVAAKKEITLAEALKIGVEQWNELQMDTLATVAPKKFKAFGGRDGVIVMVEEYWRLFGHHDTKNWHIVAAEAGFGRRREVCVGENDKVVVFYIGKPDLLIIESGRLMPLDHKSVDSVNQKKLNEQYKPHPQTAGYIFATNELAKLQGLEPNVDRCIINVAARNKPTDTPRDGGPPRPRFTRIYPNYTKMEIEEWRRQIIIKASRLRYCIENDEWMWNEKSCHIYGGCNYRVVHSSTEGSREVVVQSHFVQVEPWVPYEVDEAEGDE